MRVSLKAAGIWGGVALLGLLGLAACGRADSGSGQAPLASTEAADPGYRAPPQISDLARGPEGSLSLSGRAMPSSQVRLASPAGARLETTADGQGLWRTPLGPVSEPALYGLSAEIGGRRLQAEGYVAILPAPTVALLRAGAGAQVLGDGQPGPRLLAVDFDSGGATVVSGLAGAGAPVRVLVDGQVAIEAPAAGDGRFSLTLPKALPPGRHRIQVLTAKGAAAVAIAVGPIAPLTEEPYRITSADGGWRVDWITPGEGLQTTLLLTSSEAAH